MSQRKEYLNIIGHETYEKENVIHKNKNTLCCKEIYYSTKVSEQSL